MQYDFEKRHLFRLEEVKDDYEIASEDPDVRSWSVLDGNGDKVGVIKDLIVDLREMRVRYLDVIAVKELTTADERHLLIPIGAARVDENNDLVKVPELDKETLINYPEYTGGPITRNYEHSVRETLSGGNKEKAAFSEEEFYKNDLYDEAGFYYPRRRISVISGDRTAIAYTTIRSRSARNINEKK